MPMVSEKNTRLMVKENWWLTTNSELLQVYSLKFTTKNARHTFSHKKGWTKFKVLS